VRRQTASAISDPPTNIERDAGSESLEYTLGDSMRWMRGQAWVTNATPSRSLWRFTSPRNIRTSQRTGLTIAAACRLHDSAGSRTTCMRISPKGRPSSGWLSGGAESFPFLTHVQAGHRDDASTICNSGTHIACAATDPRNIPEPYRDCARSRLHTSKPFCLGVSANAGRKPRSFATAFKEPPLFRKNTPGAARSREQLPVNGR
jgi:hypothetical protein